MNAQLANVVSAISRGSREKRAKALEHATNLLVAGKYSDDEIWIFGELITNLMDGLEERVRASLSRRLSASANAPSEVIHLLALDESINVAGPALQYSQRLPARSLIETANTKGQRHLLAVARRRMVDQPVTDILVRRGDRIVLVAVVDNSGAAFSEFGFQQLLARSVADPVVAEHFGVRRDIPPQLFEQLIEKTSAEVRRRLMRQRTDLCGEIHDAADDPSEAFGTASKEYFAAECAVRALQKQGRLNEQQLHSFALQQNFCEAAVTLAVLSGVSVQMVHAVLRRADYETILLLAKALDLSWTTAMSLLFLASAERRITSRVLEQMQAEYAFLNVETSQEVLQVYRSRKYGRDGHGGDIGRG